MAGGTSGDSGVHFAKGTEQPALRAREHKSTKGGRANNLAGRPWKTVT